MARRDGGDLAGAVEALDASLEVCERAGLIAQSIQALSTRAIVLAIAGRDDDAREAAKETVARAERLPYSPGHAAALAAEGATLDDIDEARPGCARRPTRGTRSAARRTRRSAGCSPSARSRDATPGRRVPRWRSRLPSSPSSG